MASTKIINVQKNDSFDDVFGIFKNSEAKEIIFIFPRGSKFTKQDGYLELIKEEADKDAKLISIMTSDPIIAQQASNFGIQLLNTKRSVSSSFRKNDENNNDENSDDWQPISGDEKESYAPEEDDDKKLNSEPEEEYDEPKSDAVSAEVSSEEGLIEATLAVASAKKNVGKIMRDIINPKMDRSLKIKEDRENIFDVDIRRGIDDDNKEKDITKVWENRENENRNFIFGKKYRVKLGNKKKKIVLAASIFGILIISFLAFYGIFDRATVIIQPRTDIINLQLKISASSDAASVDDKLNIIPGQLFSFQQEESGLFPVTGSKNVVQKASGIITIYNKSIASQRLVATTRFQSPQGIIFRIPQTINVPAALKNGNTITPGSIESTVIADKPGSEYNIGITRFSIPGFEGTPKYEDFYAVSKTEMSGGQIGEAMVVTEADYLKARDAIINKLKKEISGSLIKQSGQLKVLNSTDIKFDDPITNAKIGDPTNELKMTIRGSAQIFGFRESDVKELIEKSISKKGEFDFIDNSLSIKYSGPITDAVSKTMKFTVEADINVAAKINSQKILNDILDLNGDSIRLYFKNLKEVESAYVTLFPFWVKKIPTQENKVKIIIKINGVD